MAHIAIPPTHTHTHTSPPPPAVPWLETRNRRNKNKTTSFQAREGGGSRPLRPAPYTKQKKMLTRWRPKITQSACMWHWSSARRCHHARTTCHRQETKFRQDLVIIITWPLDPLPPLFGNGKRRYQSGFRATPPPLPPLFGNGNGGW